MPAARATIDCPTAGPRLRAGGRSLGRRGLTLLEVLVAIGILAIIVAILLPVVARTRAAGQRIACLSNLRSIATAFHLYADHNSGRLPDPAHNQLSWEASLLPYCTSNTFRCPADTEVFPDLNSSYDWRDTPDPATTLAGRDILLPPRGTLVLALEALPGWHTKKKINVAYLGDGSAEEVDYEAAMRDLEIPITTR